MAYCDDNCYLLEMVMGLKTWVSAAHKQFEHFRINCAPRNCRCLQKLLKILVEKMPTAERHMKNTHNTTMRHVPPDAKSTKRHSDTWTCIEMLEPDDQSFIREMVMEIESLLENAKEELKRLVNSRAPEMTSDLEKLIKVLQEKLPNAKQILSDTCKPLYNVQQEDFLRYTMYGDTSSFRSGKQVESNQKMYPFKKAHLSIGNNISKQPFELEKLYERCNDIEGRIKFLVRKILMLEDELVEEREYTAKLREHYRTSFNQCLQCLKKTEELRRVKENAEQKESKLNTVLLELQKEHIKENENLKTSFEKQQSETDIQHKKHVNQLQEEIQKCKDDLIQYKENQNIQQEKVAHSIDLKCHNLQKEVDRLEKDKKTLMEELELERRHVQRKEDDFKNIRSNIQKIMERKELEITNLKIKYSNNQLAGHEVLNKNERLDTENFLDALQQEIAKAKRFENERDLVREELQQIKNEQFEKMQKLTVIDDIQRKVINENQELKTEINQLRLENAKIKKELTSQQELARTHDAKKQEYDNTKQTLREEISVVKQKNEQLHLDNNKLSVQLHQEKDNAKKYKRELDINSNEIKKLKKQQEALYQQSIKLNEDLSKQQEHSRKHENLELKLKSDIKILQEQLQKIQNENELLIEKLNSLKKVAKVQEDHQTKIISFQQIVSNQDKEISCLKTEIDTQKDVNTNKLKKVHQNLDEANKRNGVMIQEIKTAQVTLEQHRQQIINKEKIIDKQKTEIEKLESENKRLEAENRDKTRNSDSRLGERNAGEKGLQQQLAQMREQLTNAQKELEDTKSRLSRAMGDKLTDNNPNIADLSDRNRPTKISERYQELYDNQWTDAFEKIDGKIGNEETTIKTLIDILLETMDYCIKQSANQMTTLTETLSKGKKLSKETMKQIKDLRKASAENYGKELYLEYWKTINQSQSYWSEIATNIPQFVKECYEICWLMAVQDPPVVLGPEIRRDTPFNKDHYKAYTKSGNRLDYVVWPVLLLHKDGPVLCKGVAQGH